MLNFPLIFSTVPFKVYIPACLLCRPRPDEPTQLKATLLQTTVKLGEILPGNIGEYEPNHPKSYFWGHGCTWDDTPLSLYADLELVDQYGNPTKTLTSTCKNHMTVEAEDLDKSSIVFTWQVGKRHKLKGKFHWDCRNKCVVQHRSRI